MLSVGTRVKFKSVLPNLVMPSLLGTVVGTYEYSQSYFIELDIPAVVKSNGIKLFIITATEEFFTTEES